MIRGIDVSSVNPGTFSTSGLDFLFIKATEGRTYVNPRQNQQAATARTAGLPVGFYHFLWPGNIEQQAQHFVSACASLHGDMLVCDWETVEDGSAASCAEKDAFLRAVKALRPTHRVGLYCNVDYWKHHDTTSYCGDFLWIADPNNPGGEADILHPYLFQQTGERDGVDQDVSTFPSRQALRAWCGYA